MFGVFIAKCIINMGQTKSKDCADKKGTDNLSAQAAVNDIDILRRLAQKEGPLAVSEYIDKSFDHFSDVYITLVLSSYPRILPLQNHHLLVLNF
jgi:hypothetical protein